MRPASARMNQHFTMRGHEKPLIVSSRWQYHISWLQLHNWAGRWFHPITCWVQLERMCAFVMSNKKFDPMLSNILWKSFWRFRHLWSSRSNHRGYLELLKCQKIALVLSIICGKDVRWCVLWYQWNVMSSAMWLHLWSSNHVARFSGCVMREEDAEQALGQHCIQQLRLEAINVLELRCIVCTLPQPCEAGV